MRLLPAAAVVLLSACGAAPPRNNPPAPAIIPVPVATYVPLDAALTRRCAWVRTGAPSAVFEVSSGRKRCLDQYEAQLEAIEAVQGKPQPPPSR
ncbi:hypothetical protein [Stenotrophomonas sp. 24(2023)]|uniref:hypothetical protein n=1 Tax=Stenotrophomonas sp. 24(2023) TaxID=3068324 RepID=UPI0027E207A2|nr:hypothetical protein [Stenotrophomonas sp. 24(2023)]WMJ68814.1 hypothetical protein Q9R17_16755 [Stenotrophomonas sp. 24(2023)]